MLVEVCANSLESAINAEKAGADRIELCAELAVGGVTPSYGLLKSVRKHISIPVNVLIRPRAGDFTYSENELEIMKTNIALCIELGFAGIVSGVLRPDFSIDIDKTKILRDAASELNFTFHRAFDWLNDPMEGLTQLSTIGADTVLTSGQQSSAIKGIDLLKELKKVAKEITIMPGGGVRETNVLHFKESGFTAVHLSGVKFVTSLNSTPKVSMNSAAFLKDDAIAITDSKTISKIVELVK